MAKPIDDANVREVLSRSGEPMSAHKIAVWLGHANPKQAQRDAVTVCVDRLIAQRLCHQRGGGSTVITYKWGARG